VRHKTTTLVLALLLLLGAAITLAQGRFDLSWWTVDGGGGRSRGGRYALGGTAGQPDVGATMGGGPYRLAGGYWGGGSAGAEHALYVPLVVRQ
jgi:hypothetical protein